MLKESVCTLDVLFQEPKVVSVWNLDPPCLHLFLYKANVTP